MGELLVEDLSGVGGEVAIADGELRLVLPVLLQADGARVVRHEAVQWRFSDGSMRGWREGGGGLAAHVFEVVEFVIDHLGPVAAAARGRAAVGQIGQARLGLLAVDSQQQRAAGEVAVPRRDVHHNGVGDTADLKLRDGVVDRVDGLHAVKARGGEDLGDELAGLRQALAHRDRLLLLSCRRLLLRGVEVSSIGRRGRREPEACLVFDGLAPALAALRALEGLLDDAVDGVGRHFEPRAEAGAAVPVDDRVADGAVDVCQMRRQVGVPQLEEVRDLRAGVALEVVHGGGQHLQQRTKATDQSWVN